MKKKTMITVATLGSLATLMGISYLIHGIQEHGIFGVNYGSVIFPLAITVNTVIMFRKKKRIESENAHLC